MRESLQYASTQKATMTFKVTSRFGDTEGRTKEHIGMDFAMNENTPLSSVGDGVITELVNDNNFGKAVHIQLENGDTIVYAHLNEILVKKGQSVNAGDLVGLSGNTGYSTGPHLHVHVLNENGDIVEPSKYEPLVQAMENADYDWLLWKKQIENGWQSFFERGKVGDNPLPRQDEANSFVWGNEGTVFDTFGEVLADKIGDGIAALFFAIADSIHAVLPEIAGFASVIAGFALMMGVSMPKVLARWGVVMTAIIIWIAEG